MNNPTWHFDGPTRMSVQLPDGELHVKGKMNLTGVEAGGNIQILNGPIVMSYTTLDADPDGDGITINGAGIYIAESEIGGNITVGPRARILSSQIVSDTPVSVPEDAHVEDGDIRCPDDLSVIRLADTVNRLLRIVTVYRREDDTRVAVFRVGDTIMGVPVGRLLADVKRQAATSGPVPLGDFTDKELADVLNSDGAGDPPF